MGEIGRWQESGAGPLDVNVEWDKTGRAEGGGKVAKRKAGKRREGMEKAKWAEEESGGKVGNRE